MYSKLREDLPTIPNRRYSPEDIKLFDEHRKKYKEEVNYAKKLYSSVVSIVDVDSEEYEKSTVFVKNFVEKYEALGNLSEEFDSYASINNNYILNKENKPSRILEKYTPKELGHPIHVINLRRTVDFITAFYFPEDLEWAQLSSNEEFLGFFRGEPVEVELEYLLSNSLSVPESNGYFLEVLLWRSNHGENTISHSQEEKIEIDGMIYKRVIFIQPFLPMVAIPFSCLKLHLNDSRDIYIEGSVLSSLEERERNAVKKYILWYEDKTKWRPLLSVKDGVIHNPYDYGRAMIDELWDDDIYQSDLLEMEEWQPKDIIKDSLPDPEIISSKIS